MCERNFLKNILTPPFVHVARVAAFRAYQPAIRHQKVVTCEIFSAVITSFRGNIIARAVWASIVFFIWGCIQIVFFNISLGFFKKAVAIEAVIQAQKLFSSISDSQMPLAKTLNAENRDSILLNSLDTPFSENRVLREIFFFVLYPDSIIHSRNLR